MKQTASRILVMGAALLSAAPAAGAGAVSPDGDTAAPLPLLPPPSPSPSPGEPASPPSPVPPPMWGPGPTGFSSGPPPWLAEPYPDDFSKPRRSWYGWQILLPGILSDFLGVIGFFAFPPLLIVGAAGHGITGPIVHLAHGHIGSAGASFLLEAVLPLAAIGSTVVSVGGICRGDCIGPTVIGFISIPVTLIGGMVVDAAVLAREDVAHREATAQGRGGPVFSLAPLLVAPLRADQGMASVWRKGWSREAPIGLSLVGRF